MGAPVQRRASCPARAAWCQVLARWRSRSVPRMRRTHSRERPRARRDEPAAASCATPEIDDEDALVREPRAVSRERLHRGALKHRASAAERRTMTRAEEPLTLDIHCAPQVRTD